MKVSLLLLLLFLCASAEKKGINNPQFHSYWHDNGAEISVFELEQARYGEVHKGEAVFIFVTEKMNPETQIKAETAETLERGRPVLKLNKVVKFPTGVYDYSIMQSVFSLIDSVQPTFRKLTTSVQEWCGQVFSQINYRKDSLHYMGRSYFESEGDISQVRSYVPLEEELLMTMRIAPEQLPVGSFSLIPSQVYLRLQHREVKEYSVIATQVSRGSDRYYSLFYPALSRTVTIIYGAQFPHPIKGWSEEYESGFGEKRKRLTTKATLKKRSFLAYWEKNRVMDTSLRRGLRQ